ncbi:hypothetical protein PtA15_8A130 [Puccinia triticina]|uniref:Uncharacterized protein n=1 Tax=Puccinia triticina TaxID=208348 RepID=A0ABY7CQL3_9BASI|nr:uncharacterized protein PtA15_8A130 [Puccinia triticina]WAQ87228.1 hypothetical protein PtA15_8A130 [Puccinia triticina]
MQYSSFLFLAALVLIPSQAISFITFACDDNSPKNVNKKTGKCIRQITNYDRTDTTINYLLKPDSIVLAIDANRVGGFGSVSFTCDGQTIGLGKVEQTICTDFQQNLLGTDPYSFADLATHAYPKKPAGSKRPRSL